MAPGSAQPGAMEPELAALVSVANASPDMKKPKQLRTADTSQQSAANNAATMTEREVAAHLGTNVRTIRRGIARQASVRTPADPIPSLAPRRSSVARHHRARSTPLVANAGCADRARSGDRRSVAGAPGPRAVSPGPPPRRAGHCCRAGEFGAVGSVPRLLALAPSLVPLHVRGSGSSLRRRCLSPSLPAWHLGALWCVT